MTPVPNRRRPRSQRLLPPSPPVETAAPPPQSTGRATTTPPPPPPPSSPLRSPRLTRPPRPRRGRLRTSWGTYRGCRRTTRGTPPRRRGKVAKGPRKMGKETLLGSHVTSCLIIAFSYFAAVPTPPPWPCPTLTASTSLPSRLILPPRQVTPPRPLWTWTRCSTWRMCRRPRGTRPAQATHLRSSRLSRRRSQSRQLQVTLSKYQFANSFPPNVFFFSSSFVQICSPE